MPRAPRLGFRRCGRRTRQSPSCKTAWSTWNAFRPSWQLSGILPVVVICPVERAGVDSPSAGGGRRALKVPDDDLGGRFAALFAGSTFRGRLRSAPGFQDRHLAQASASNAARYTARPPAAASHAGVLREAAIGDLAREIVREAILVGRAEGAVLPDSLDAIPILQAITGDAVAPDLDQLGPPRRSALAGSPDGDRRPQRRLSSAWGRKHGIPTPPIVIRMVASAARRL